MTLGPKTLAVLLLAALATALTLIAPLGALVAIGWPADTIPTAEAARAISDVDASVQDRARTAVLQAALVALVPLVTLAALFGIVLHNLRQPLIALTGVMRGVASGDTSRPARTERRDEIGRLHNAALDMIDSLSDQIRDAATLPAGLARSEARFRDFAELAADWVWETDAKGHVTYFSGQVANTAGIDCQAVIGKPLGVLMRVPRGDGSSGTLELASRRPIRNLTCVVDGPVGAQHHYRLEARAIVEADGRFLGYRGIARDITASIMAEQEADRLAFRDPLTGLANRTRLLDRLEQALEARPITRGDVAVIVLDIDGFKNKNDKFGHGTGDDILCDIGARLRTCVGPQDTVARIDGDAFAIVQATGAQPEAAEHLCLTLLQAIRKPVELGELSVSFTASLGCAIAAPEDINAVNLLRNADVAMYRAKDDGSDTYRFHEPAMTAALQTRITMERDLRQAIETDAIEVHYQPMLSAETRTIIGFEAVARWPRPGHGMVYPGAFLSLAEETGLIVPLSNHVMRTACRTAMSWPDLNIAVNLSSGHFLHESLLGTVTGILRETCLSPNLLELEITEAAFLSSEDTASFQFDALRDLGVRMVMDKFGTGTSSLQHLQRYPFDKLKLHRTFVAGLDHDPGAAKIAASVIQLTHALDMQSVAGGIKSEAQAQRLSDLGCQVLQGPLYGKAMTAARAFALLRMQGSLPGAPKAERSL